MVRHRVEWIGSGMDGLMRSSKGQIRSGICEMSSSERRGKRAERREKREERREKREERDKHDQDERVEGRNGSVPNKEGWYRGTTRTHSQA